MKKYVLVVHSYSNKEYMRVIGEPTEEYKKLCKAMKGLDMRLGDDYFSTIEEVEDARKNSKLLWRRVVAPTRARNIHEYGTKRNEKTALRGDRNTIKVAKQINGWEFRDNEWRCWIWRL